jgi:MOSC domain-containing protein YiiM
MAILRSINVGRPRNVSWQGRTVYTGVWKAPVDGPVTVHRLNVHGDGQGDLGGHGGEQRAVFVYQLDSYRHWQDFLHRDDFTYGPATGSASGWLTRGSRRCSCSIAGPGSISACSPRVR